MGDISPECLRGAGRAEEYLLFVRLRLFEDPGLFFSEHFCGCAVEHLDLVFQQRKHLKRGSEHFVYQKLDSLRVRCYVFGEERPDVCIKILEVVVQENAFRFNVVGQVSCDLLGFRETQSESDVCRGNLLSSDFCLYRSRMAHIALCACSTGSLAIGSVWCSLRRAPEGAGLNSCHRPLAYIMFPCLTSNTT